MHAMTWRRCSAWALLACVALVPMQPAAAGEPSALSAMQWLSRIQQAAKDRSYVGVSVSSVGGAMSSIRVVHLVEAGQVVERVEQLDGEPQLTIRQGDQIHRLWPARRTSVVEARSAGLSLPSATLSLDPRLLHHYEVKVLGVERVTGRDAQLLWLRPRDEFRFAQRLWVDVGTGLLLRSEVLGPKEEVLEAVGFSSLDLQPRIQLNAVLEPLRRLDGYRVVQRQSASTQLEAEGWSLSAAVPGFSLVNCVKRVIGQGDAGPASPVLQAVYSDGLSNVSLFIERQEKPGMNKSAYGQHGATHTVAQALGAEHWVTAMGDVPPGTLRQFLKGLDKRR